MQLTCPACGITTVIPDDHLPPEGARARCHSCAAMSVYHRGGLVADDPTPPKGLPLPEPIAVADDPRLASLPMLALGHGREAPPPPVHAPAGLAPSDGWQVRTARGNEGPLQVEALKTMIRAGRLAADDLACPPGDAQWTRAGDLPQLKRWLSLARPAATFRKYAAFLDRLGETGKAEQVRRLDDGHERRRRDRTLR